MSWNEILAASNQPIWQGSSRGAQIQWTTEDLVIQPVGAAATQRVSFRNSQTQWFNGAIKEARADGFVKSIDHEQTARILSVVGPYVSLETMEYTEQNPSAHPSQYTQFAAWDSRRLLQSPLGFADEKLRIPLTEIFPESDILKALLADSLVQKALAETDGKPKPTTLKALITQLQNVMECEYYFGQDMLQRFAFHHLEKNKAGQPLVAVRIGLSHGAEVCRGKLTQLGILLPIPPTLSAALQKAASRQEGFLMNYSERAFRNKETQLEFHYKK